MKKDELEAYLHEHIPISSAMGVTVVSSGAERTVLAAPLSPNINHRDTVFGGSAASVAMLAGWSLMRLRLNEEKIDCRIVIQKSEMKFSSPIASDFNASASLADPSDWARFADTFRKRGLARTKVRVAVGIENKTAAEFTGVFAATKKL